MHAKYYTEIFLKTTAIFKAIQSIFGDFNDIAEDFMGMTAIVINWWCIDGIDNNEYGGSSFMIVTDDSRW